MKLRRLLTPILTLAILGGGGWYVYDRYIVVEAPKIEYQSEPAARGRVTATVTASGTLSPLKTVQVGSQVSGRIVELLADFNTQVKKGDVIARIDPSLLESDKARSQANLQSARASYNKAVADRDNAKLIYERTKRLVADGVAAQQELEATLTTYTAAKANVDAASAAVAVARAAIETADTNLHYTTIVSPIDGVVISRDVSVGQTVAASLSAPTIFTIAEDLRAMEVHTNVAESDVGQLLPDMKVTFTVDAYPGEKFRGVVHQIRNAAQTLQNVVTYDAVVRVDNDALKLRPGMTASVTFIVEDRRDALLVPNVALRFIPPDPAIAALAPPAQNEGGRGGKRRRADDAEAPGKAEAGDAQPGAPTAGTAPGQVAANAQPGSPATEGKADAKAPAGGPAGPAQPGTPDAKAPSAPPAGSAATPGTAPAADAQPAGAAPATPSPESRRAARASTRTVWKLVDGQPKPVQVQIGISDGTVTEVTGGELAEGDLIVTGASGGATPAAAPTKSSSPLSGGGGGARGGGGGGGRRGGF